MNSRCLLAGGTRLRVWEQVNPLSADEWDGPPSCSVCPNPPGLPVPGWRPDDSNRAGQPDYGKACAWLPPVLRLQAGELLASGEKIAQEHLGLQALLGDLTLIAGLAS